MSYTKQIIEDSYSRFKNNNWVDIASTRIEETYKKRGNEPIGEVTYYNFTSVGIIFIVKAIVAMMVLITLVSI